MLQRVLILLWEKPECLSEKINPAR